MRRTILLPLLLLLGWACRTTGTPATSSPIDTGDAHPDSGESGTEGPASDVPASAVDSGTGGPASDASAPAEDSGAAAPATLVRITPAEAEAYGLPPAAFSLDTAGTPLAAHRFPDSNTYVTVSGPPGGPQLVRIQTLPELPADGAALEPLLHERFNRPGAQPLVFGTPTRVALAGAEHPALPLVTAHAMARTGWCAIAVPAGPDGGPPGLLVLAGVGTQGEPDCAVPLANDGLRRVLDTLRLEAGAAAGTRP